MAEVPRSGHHGSTLHQNHAEDPQLAGAWNERILSDSGTSAVAIAAGDKGEGREWTADTLLPKVTQQLRMLYPWCEDMPLQFEALAKQQTKLMLRELYADSAGNIPGNTGLCDSHPTSDVSLDLGPSPGVQTQEAAVHQVRAPGCQDAVSPTSTISKMQPPQCQNSSSGLQPSIPDTCNHSHVTFQYGSTAFQGVDEFPFQCWDPWGVLQKPPPGMTSALVEEPVLSKPPPGMTSARVEEPVLSKPPPGMTSALVEEPVLSKPPGMTSALVEEPVLSKPPSGMTLALVEEPVLSKPPPGMTSALVTFVTSAKPSSSRQDCQPSSVAMTTGVSTNTQGLRPSFENKKSFVLANSEPAGRPKTNKPSSPVNSDSVGWHGQQGQVTDKEKRLTRHDNRRTDDNVPSPVVVEDWGDEIEQFPAGFGCNCHPHKLKLFQPRDKVPSPVVVEDWEGEIEQFPAGFRGTYHAHKLELFQSRDKEEEILGESKLKGIPGLVVNAPQEQASGRSRKSSRAEEQPKGKTQVENAATKDRRLQYESNLPYQQQWVKIGKQGKQKKKSGSGKKASVRWTLADGY